MVEHSANIFAENAVQASSENIQNLKQPASAGRTAERRIHTLSQNQTKLPSFSEEFKVVALRECPLPEEMKICVEPQQAVDYWRLNIVTCPYFNPECECFVVLLLNTRKRVRGHQLVSFGTMNTVLVHPREVFRVAVICGAANIILMHNHPSGEPQPSEADIKVTRDLVRAGQLMQIDVVDHVIVGNGKHCSLRELGHICYT